MLELIKIIKIKMIHFFLVLFLINSIFVVAQKDTLNHTKKNTFSIEANIGLGMGLDYGGIGVNILIYPHKNIGAFGSFGYAIAGLGWNAGIKTRLSAKNYFINPYLVAMYGYNTAVYFKNMPALSQTFNGLSFGLGVDISLSKSGKVKLQLGLLIPIRTSDAIRFINKYTHGASPVLPSVGLKF